eukprot:Nk52_evm49s217 gene=Nk52_evmTU49s217
MLSKIGLWLISLIVVSICCNVEGWGEVGHRVVANIATKYLHAETLANVETILGNKSLLDVANWADTVSHTEQYAWSYKLHFVNLPKWKCQFHWRYCEDGKCAAAAIKNFTEVLYKSLHDPSVDDKTTEEAMKFLIHIIGDIHQPLHVGFGLDHGGNDIPIKFADMDTNLHSAWDSDFINKWLSEKQGGDEEAAANVIIQMYSKMFKYYKRCTLKGQKVCPKIWARSSAKVCCKSTYRDTYGEVIKPGFVVPKQYYRKSINIIQSRLAMAGIRLASALNRIYHPDEGSLSYHFKPKEKGKK